MTTTTLSPELTAAEEFAAEKEAFAERLLETMNHGALTMMLSIGHRTGLFDVMAKLPPSTSAQIADAAGLNERYVREWLGAMVTGRIVEYHPVAKTYHLPAVHAAHLTRAAGGENIAQTMQWMSVLGHVEDRVLESFRNGGGVHYHEYHRFHETMADESTLTVVAALRDAILPLVPGLIDRLEHGVNVLEIGCGSGRALCELAEMFPNSTFTAYDLCEPPIAAAQAEAARRGLTNARFEVRDVTNLDHEGNIDLVLAFDVVHDQKDPAAVLGQVRRALRPGGVFLMQDISASSHVERNVDHPLGPFLYTISTMHCMTVSLAQDGAGLGTCWGVELALQMLDEAGFTDVRVRQLPHDIINNYYTMRKA